MDLARIIYFTDTVDDMVAFYRDVMGCVLIADEPGWKELKAGQGIIAIHGGAKGPPNAYSPKIAFKCDDVPAMRAQLIAKGIEMGPLWEGEISFCDGVDPGGYAFSISNR